MTVPNALILAGSGMLSAIEAELAINGWRVVAPSRRRSPVLADRRDQTATCLIPAAGSRRGRRGAGSVIWTEARWDQPFELAHHVRTALTAPAELLVTWLHESYEPAVLTAVEPLLAPHAPVVEVRALPDPRRLSGDEELEPLLGDHPTQQILLGDVSERDVERALGQQEILQGVCEAVRRALSGHCPSLHQIGERRPMYSH